MVAAFFIGGFFRVEGLQGLQAFLLLRLTCLTYFLTLLLSALCFSLFTLLPDTADNQA